MARDRGTFDFSANLEPLVKGPLDARSKVELKQDLFDPATWTDNDNNMWLYDGLPVYVWEEDAYYVLSDHTDYANDSAWSKLDVNSMKWKSNWTTSEEYERNDVVLDDGWLMIANTATGEHAAPQPIGTEYWVYKGTGAISAITPNDVNFIIVGVEYIMPADAFINGIRIYVDEWDGYEYQLVIRDATDPNDVKDFVGSNNTYTEVGWKDINIKPRLVFNGSTMQFFVIIRNHNTMPSETTLSYNYNTPNRNPGSTNNGEIIHANDTLNNLYIDNWDNDGNDNTAFLQSLEAGDKIKIGDVEWDIIGAIKEEVNAHGTTFIFTVSPPTQYGSDGVTNVTFTHYVPAKVGYVAEPSYWSGNPNISGIYSEDDYENPTINDNAYGVDILVQETYISTDWDFMATTSSFGGGGSGSSNFIDLTDTPSTYVGEAHKLVTVKSTEDGLGFITRDSMGYITDAPSDNFRYGRMNQNWVNLDNQYATQSALDAHTGNTSNPHSVTLAQLNGEPDLGVPSVDGYILSSDTGGTRLWVEHSFLNLTDTPGDYLGTEGLYLRVNATGDGIEFATNDYVEEAPNDTIFYARYARSWVDISDNYPTEDEFNDHLNDHGNPHLVTSAQTGAEAALGNPSTNGYVLSSTTTGDRSWVEMDSGSHNFYELDDTPLDYQGAADMFVQVLNDESGLTFASLPTTYENGLSLSGMTVRWGGDLTQDTTITTNVNQRHVSYQFTNSSGDHSTDIMLRNDYVQFIQHINGDSSGDYIQFYMDGGTMFTLGAFKSTGETSSITFYNWGTEFKDTAHSKGIRYYADYSGVGTGDDRWIPDYGAVKAYADSVAGPTTFAALDDTPIDYQGAGGMFVQVLDNETALTFKALPTTYGEGLEVIGGDKVVLGGSTTMPDTHDLILNPGDVTFNITDKGSGYSYTFLESWVDNDNNARFETVVQSGAIVHDIYNKVSGNEYKVSFVEGGMKYAADYSGTGSSDDRWIPDYGAVKAYADSVSGSSTFAGLSDTPVDYQGAGGLYLKVTDAEDGIEFITPPDRFTALEDTPSSYSGYGFHAVFVKDDQTGLEFTSKLYDDSTNGLTITPGLFIISDSSGPVYLKIADWNSGKTAFIGYDSGASTFNYGFGNSTSEATGIMINDDNTVGIGGKADTTYALDVNGRFHVHGNTKINIQNVENYSFHVTEEDLTGSASDSNIMAAFTKYIPSTGGKYSRNLYVNSNPSIAGSNTKHFALDVMLYNSTSADYGMMHGIRSITGGATAGYTAAILGALYTDEPGAAIFGTVNTTEAIKFSAQYAGYFDGDTNVSGSIEVTDNVFVKIDPSADYASLQVSHPELFEVRSDGETYVKLEDLVKYIASKIWWL